MPRSLLGDAFAHHVWATGRLIESCQRLDPDQLGAAVPGTYGSVLETMRHLVGADAAYLYAMTSGRTSYVDTSRMSLTELSEAMAKDGAAWKDLLVEGPDPDAVVVRRREDGSETHAPVGIRLAQVLQHGTDHRSQICTVLTVLGLEPPDIDVWSFADQAGQLVEVPPTS